MLASNLDIIFLEENATIHSVSWELDHLQSLHLEIAFKSGRRMWTIVMMDNGSLRKKGKEGHPTILKMESFLIFSGSTFLLCSVAFDQP